MVLCLGVDIWLHCKFVVELGKIGVVEEIHMCHGSMFSNPVASLPYFIGNSLQSEIAHDNTQEIKKILKQMTC